MRKALIAVLRPLGRVRVICEATGGYQHAVVAALLAAKIEVGVVSPSRVCATSLTRRASARENRSTGRYAPAAPLWTARSATRDR